MTNNLTHRLVGYSPSVLSAFRVVYGFLFAAHGSMILFGWPIATGHHVGVGDWPGWYAGVIELITGLMVGVGLLTRGAAFLASGTMAVAYFWMHQPNALWPVGEPPQGNGGEPAILFCFAFFLLVFLGPGRYSVDGLASARKRRP